MNENVEKLYNLAHKEVIETSDYNGMPSVELEFDPEKFAKLIIEQYSYNLMDIHAATPERVVLAARFWGVEL